MFLNGCAWELSVLGLKLKILQDLTGSCWLQASSYGAKIDGIELGKII